MTPGATARRVASALLVAIAAIALAGCQYLYGPEIDDEFAPPSPLATYAQGTASIAIGADPAIVLDRLGSGGLYDSWYGGEATWSNEAGWYVRLSGASALSSGFLDGGGFASIQLDRIVDGAHWTTYDPSRCVITIETVDKTGLSGTASCKGLRWSDALVGGMGTLEPPFIDGQDPFDAEITFEAKPASGSAS